MLRNQTILNMIAFTGAVTLIGAMLQSGTELCADADTVTDRVGATAFASASRSEETIGPSDKSGTRAADLSVIVRANGSSAITVTPGAEIHYEVVGELSDNANEGLACFHFDLEFDGGDLLQTDTPTDPPMSSFVIPDGYTNPAGFGGTDDVPGQEGDLVQVGGCQNTIKNTADNAPYPIGSVITGIAWPGSPEVLVTGTLTAPAAQGIYTLELTNLAARVIKQGETGVPFWETVSAGAGAITSLTIAVLSTGDCNANGIPDECDIDCGPASGPCDVPGCGESEDDDGNGIPDECEVMRPDPWEFDEYGGSCEQDSDCWGPAETVAYCVPAPGGTYPGTCYAPASRYLSIARNTGQVENTARRIVLQGGGAGPWWVGSPTYNAAEDMYFASVSSTSVYAGIDGGEWIDGDWPEVIQVKGCEIAPGQTYEVQAIQYGSDEADEGSYSEVLALTTAPRWGDIVSTCFFSHCLPPTGAFTEPSIDDVLAVVNAFTGVRNAPLPWVDVDPVFADGEPEGMWALIGDVLAVVNAFSGQAYPGNGPVACSP